MIDDSIVEVIKEGEIIRMSGSKAKEEDLFVLRKIIEPEKPFIEDKKSKAVIQTSASIEDWKRKRFNYRQNNVLKDLKDNFHWDIAKYRRERALSRKQLASAVNAPEEEIKILEFGELPSDDFVLINKIERFFGINLRREKPKEEISLADLQKMSEDKVREILDKRRGKDTAESKDSFSGSDIEILEK